MQSILEYIPASNLSLKVLHESRRRKVCKDSVLRIQFLYESDSTETVAMVTPAVRLSVTASKSDSSALEARSVVMVHCQLSTYALKNQLCSTSSDLSFQLEKLFRNQNQKFNKTEYCLIENFCVIKVNGISVRIYCGFYQQINLKCLLFSAQSDNSVSSQCRPTSDLSYPAYNLNC